MRCAHTDNSTLIDAMKKQRKQQLWFRAVRVVDVLVAKNGVLRVVRRVSFYDNGDLRSISCVIRCCSWTGRGTTTMNYHDINRNGLQPTGKRVRLTKAIDKAIANNLARSYPYDITCCMTKGLA